VADGRWSQSAVSKQVGVVPILIKLGYAKHDQNWQHIAHLTFGKWALALC